MSSSLVNFPHLLTLISFDYWAIALFSNLNLFGMWVGPQSKVCSRLRRTQDHIDPFLSYSPYTFARESPPNTLVQFQKWVLFGEQLGVRGILAVSNFHFRYFSTFWPNFVWSEEQLQLLEQQDPFSLSKTLLASARLPCQNSLSNWLFACNDLPSSKCWSPAKIEPFSYQYFALVLFSQLAN